MSNAAVLPMGYDNPPALITVDAADFDGDGSDAGSPNLTRGAGLTGAADSKKGILSFWIDPYTFNITRRIVVGSAVLATWLTDGTHVRFRASAPLGGPGVCLEGWNSSGTLILQAKCATGLLSSAGWNHYLMAWDLATGSVQILRNGANDLSSIDVATNDTLDYTLADWGVCKATAGGSNGDNSLAELYFAPGYKLDFSYIGNVRKFYSTTGKPVNLGATGQLPVGVTPAIYMHLAAAEAVANFNANDGAGGAFTLGGGGTYAVAATSPSD